MNLSFQNVDLLCSRVDFAVGRPVIDMRRVTFVEPFALIYLGMFIRHHNRRGVYFEVQPPRSDRVQSYLESQKFWPRYNIAGAPGPKTQILRVAKFTSFNDIIDIENRDYIAEDIGHMVYRLLSNRSIRVDVSLVEELTSELVDNFNQHSQEELAACAVQWYPQMGRFDLAIGDCGIGIRRSLSLNPNLGYLRDRRHSDAAARAFEAGVGRRSEGGMGLTEVSQNVIDLGGSLFLSTGDGWVFVDASGPRIGNQAYDLPGVQIEVSIPTES